MAVCGELPTARNEFAEQTMLDGESVFVDGTVV
jgi:hypothetical protein